MRGQLGIVSVLGAALVAGCTSGPMGSQPELYGILMQHAITRDDSLRLANSGQVVAVVRADSAFVLLTSASYTQLTQLPGVLMVGQPLGASATTNVEIRIGVTPASLAVADSLASLIGRVESPQVLATEVYALVSANRLSELNRFPQISDLWLGFDPAHVARLAP
jgi:hypothetical protein